ncbi:MAG: acyl--CoA ligase [Akkermansiaceae bacterium]|nr:acyl--CoA ligase [Akkermansiaceae bacterium]
MLYLRWLETSRRHAARPAVFDSGRVVSFSELAERVEQAPVAECTLVARTGDAGFFVTILRAWRDGVAVIPIEKDAPEPVLKCDPPEGTCLVKYTPGSSGVPRAIFFRDRQVIADGDRLFHAMGLSPQVPNLAVISLAHSYGFSNVVMQMILHGVPVCLAAVPFPRVVEEICREQESVTIPAVPSIWRAWHRAGILPSLPVKLAVSAGAPLSLLLEREIFEAAGLKIHNFYGASECGGISFDATTTPRDQPDMVGTPLPGVSVSIGAMGRLLVESDAVGTGYDEGRDDDQLKDGRYLTRDIAFLDGESILHLSCSTGGAINVSGRKISPSKVEAALMATGLLRRVRVFGVPSPDPDRFEEILALYDAGPGVTVEALKHATSSRLELWELPRHWYDAPELWQLDAAALKAKWVAKEL